MEEKKIGKRRHSVCAVYETYERINGRQYGREYRLYPCGLTQTAEIDIKYVRPGMEPIGYAGDDDDSDWIDLRAGEDVDLEPFQTYAIPLGVAMALPIGYEAHIEARSSTYDNFKIIKINSGVIDGRYCGPNDEWHFEALAIEKTHIPKNARICQFRIIMKQPKVHFVEVDDLEGTDRGGYGTTGVD